MEMFYRFSLKKFNNDVEDESDRLCLQGFFLDALLEEPHWRGRNSEEFSSQDQKDICWKRPRPPCWWLHFQKNNIKKKISPVSSQLVKNQKKKCATLYLIERYLIGRVGSLLEAFISLGRRYDLSVNKRLLVLRSPSCHLMPPPVRTLTFSNGATCG